LTKPIITTCGSGVTACVLALALYQIGKADAAVYDGSWSEWGMYGDLPIATGPADA
jgi:thiosulfate/3-mercaptopyruvate sulfurtransferase